MDEEVNEAATEGDVGSWNANERLRGDCNGDE